MSKTLNKKDTLVVNLYGGPGAGKSTNAAALFVELKNRGINCELVREYAKDLVWEERSVEFYDQFTVLGKQVKRVNALIGKVDIIITDSPIILSCHYNTLHNKQCFDKIVLDLHNTYKNLDVVVSRQKGYNPKGRFQTEEQAKEIDREVTLMLREYGINHIIFKPQEQSIASLADLAMKLQKCQGITNNTPTK